MRNVWMLGLALAVLVAAGCGGGGSEAAARPLDERMQLSDDAPIESTEAPQPDAEYVGSWEAELTSDELVDAAADVRYAGQFRLELRGDGSYTTFQELDGESNGEFRPAGDGFLVFAKDKGCDVNTASTGTYAWAVEGDQLTLTLAQQESGGCTGRSDSLILPRWNRVAE